MLEKSKKDISAAQRRVEEHIETANQRYDEVGEVYKKVEGMLDRLEEEKKDKST